MEPDIKGKYRYLALSDVHRRYRSARLTSELHPSKVDQKEFVHGSYGALLFDPRWKAKRLMILKRDTNKCIICKSPENLQIHHRQYHFIKSIKSFSPPWDYEDKLLITLCQFCHQKGHRQYNVPTKYI